jgi:Uri superfamily endonuclease
MDKKLAAPASPGTYLLALRLPQPRCIRVGALGPINFQPGLYVYLGSARGPGGLAARLGRHCEGGRSEHWHLDYLRTSAKPVLAGWRTGRRRLECAWARRLARAAGTSPQIPGFGSSDCRCLTHLVRVSAVRTELIAAIGRILPSAQLQCFDVAEHTTKCVTSEPRTTYDFSAV